MQFSSGVKESSEGDETENGTGKGVRGERGKGRRGKILVI